MCRFWRSPDELGGVVSRSVVQIIKAHPAEGWVRARYSTSPEVTNALRQKIDELSATLEASRIAPPPQAEGLAKGKEQFTLRFSYQTWGAGRYQQQRDQLMLSWDDIFALVGPIMFDEAPEDDLRRQLTLKFSSHANLPAVGGLQQLAVNEEDFQTVKVQLRALGLIQKSTRKRAVRDTQTYWSLTPYGENYATVLKAIRSAS